MLNDKNSPQCVMIRSAEYGTGIATEFNTELLEKCVLFVHALPGIIVIDQARDSHPRVMLRSGVYGGTRYLVPGTT